MLVFVCLILAIGYVADYVNRKNVLLLACLSMCTLAYPLFVMLSSQSLWQIYIAMAIFTFIFSLYIPTAFVTMVELFSTQMRYSGLSFGFNFGLAIFGGTCPLIATWLIEITGNNQSPAYYMMIAAASAFLICIHLTRKARVLVFPV